MTPDSITLEQALELLELPRTVGVDPATGEEIVARNGRYGPYIQKGTDSRSLESEELLLTVDVEAAMALFAQPEAAPLRASGGCAGAEVGPDPRPGR